MGNSVEAGWYDDPEGSARLRYWDGTDWTEHFHEPETEPQTASDTTVDSTATELSQGVQQAQPAQTVDPYTAQPHAAQPNYGQPQQPQHQPQQPQYVHAQQPVQHMHYYQNQGPTPGTAIPARSPMEYIKEGFTTKLFDFSGRARRAEYFWVAVVGSFLASLLGLIAFILIVAVTASASEDLAVIGVIPYLIAIVGAILSSLSSGIRRCHDLGHGLGVYIVGMFIPFFGLYLLLADSKPFPNQYGDSPKYVARTSHPGPF